MVGKRFHIARLILRTGLRRRWIRSSPASLLVVNYHRLRPSGHSKSQFDDGVFGPSVDEFRRQMEWLRAATTVLDESGLIEMSEQASARRGELYSAVTFDDAYIDCYSLARPVLDAVGIKGIFFVPVDMINTRNLGWWDLAAYLLKKTNKSVVAVGNDVLDLRAEFRRSLRRILNLFKLRPIEETAELLEELSHACDVPLPAQEVQGAQLMTWDQLRELRAAGHGVGSHTFSHRVLATLSQPQQEREIKLSRAELQERMNVPVLSFAYPVGGQQHINRFSIELAREAGYELAFTFNTGIAELPIADRFQIPRESAHSVDLLKAKALMPGLMGLRHKRAG